MLALSHTKPYRPDNIDLLKEAVRRSLESGMLTTELPLNEAQLEALQSYAGFLEGADDPRRAYADMATGSGKTGLFSVIIRHLYRILDERSLQGDFKTYIIEPTVNLLEQTQGDLVEIGPELESLVGVYGGGSKQLNKPITIMTYDAWVELLEAGRLEDGFHITDEGHYALSARRQDLFEGPSAPLADSLHFGVTATSQYDEEKSLEKTHKNLIYKLSLREGIERGILADYVHVQYAVMRLLPSSANAEDVDDSNVDYNFLKQLEWSRLITHTYAHEHDEISGQPLSDKIGIVFTADTRHADRTAKMMNNDPALKAKAKRLGFENVAISIHTRDMTPAVQKQLQKDFEAGRYMVAVGDKKFKVGFDYRRIKFTASYPTGSLVDAVQEPGRATRDYINPETGLPEGAVIFEAIPYIGDNDPKLDSRARKAALAKCVTAYEVLGDTVVYRKGSKARLKKKTKVSPRAEGGKVITFSPGCTAEMFLTEQDTLTIARQIDAARLDDERIELSPEMFVDLKERIRSKGGFGAIKLFQETEEYEKHSEEPKSGLTTGIIHYVLMGGTIGKFQWHRLNQVIDNLPFLNPSERIFLTLETLADFKLKVESRGNFGPKTLMNKVQAYELENNLSSTGLTHLVIQGLLNIQVKSCDALQWQRLNEVSDSLPVIRLVERITITPTMLAEFNAKVRAKGKPGNKTIIKKIEEYEAQKGLSSCGITYGIIQGLNTTTKTFDPLHWERLNEALDTIPTAQYSVRIKISPEMIADIKDRMDKRGKLGSIKLAREIEDYEKAAGKPSVKITSSQINILINGKRKPQSWSKDKWLILNEVVDSLPLSEPSKRIELTLEMVDSLKSSLKVKGIGSAKSFADQIDKFDSEDISENVKITESTVNCIWGRSIKTVDSKQWQRLIEITNKLPFVAPTPVTRKPKSQKSAVLQAALATSTPDTKSINEIVAEQLASMLGGGTDDLVARIADAVFAKMQAQQVAPVIEKPPEVVPEVEQPALLPAPVRRSRAFPRQKPGGMREALAAALPIPPATAPQHVAKPARTVAPDPLPAAAITKIPPPAAEAIPSAVELQSFDIPLFQNCDARGDSMVSCLSYARQAMGIGDQVGVKSNLRKFTEFLLHKTLLHISDDAVVGILNLSAGDANILKGITHSYAHLCAQQGRNTRKSGFVPKSQRVELGDRLKAFYDATKLLSRYDSKRFPISPYRAAQDIAIDGGDLHYQSQQAEPRSPAATMHNALYLAGWFKETFAHLDDANPEPEAEVMMISAPLAEEPETPAKPVLSQTLLKVLNIPAAVLQDEGKASILEHIAGLAAQWTGEPAAIKAATNRSIQQAYKSVKPGVEALLQAGASVDQIAKELNKHADVTTPFEWTPATLLRGAALTMGKLPLAAFAAAPAPDKPVLAIKKPAGPKPR